MNQSESIKSDVTLFVQKWKEVIERNPSESVWVELMKDVEGLERYYKQDQILIDQLSQALLDLTDTWNERRWAKNETI